MFLREDYTPEERQILARYFTNTDLPVFALVNLPEIVKGALFARYSRTHTPLRRLFLDEFYRSAEHGVKTIAAHLGDDGNGEKRSLDRAEKLYDRVFVDYGDDSVAQLGGAHLACEQVSGLLAKVIERGRLAAYLEQSTRYIRYDDRVQFVGRRAASDTGSDPGRYRYVIPPELTDIGPRSRYIDGMDSLFDAYSKLVVALTPEFERRFPRGADESPGAHRAAVRAKVCDSVRGLLPASTFSNVGVFASGQAYESMLLRMRAHPLAESRSYAEMMLRELRKVIPGFLKRVDVEDRGVRWGRYLAETRDAMQDLADGLDEAPPTSTSPFDYQRDEVNLLEWDREAEEKLVAACLFPYSRLSEHDLRIRASMMSTAERLEVIKAYIGDRGNRRHKPGRGFERIGYRFEILSDFGSFRDLQRHRMLSIDWQLLSPEHGYSTPPEIEDAADAVSDLWYAAMERSAELYSTFAADVGREFAQYVVPFAYRIRYVMQMNARQALYMLELRTSREGHSDYRRICLRMRDLIREQAGHRAVAEAMRYVDARDYGLGRLASEQRRELRGSTPLEVGE